MVEKTLDAPLFVYDVKDFSYTVGNDDEKSTLDRILEENWKKAEEQKTFRYKLEIKKWKVLEGSYRFLAQLNVDRAENRRAPEDITTMRQPFDAKRFNFTKLRAKEILLNVGDATGNNVIAVNASPVERGHCLILPRRLECFPQIITEFSLLMALDLLLLSRSRCFRLIFNSLCAHASVNHLHWHLYYLRHEMLLEDVELRVLEGPVFTLRDYPAKGFCLKLSWFADRDVTSFRSWSYFLINYLQENNIAHNVYITRGKCDSREKIYDDIRIYIWPRKPSSGIKDVRAFVPAVCEFFGHLSIKSEEEYGNLTEKKVVRILEDATADVFDGIKDVIRDKIANKMKAQM